MDYVNYLMQNRLARLSGWHANNNKYLPQHRFSAIADTQGRGAKLADDEKSPGCAIGSAIQAAKAAAAAKTDRADLSKTLVKSPEWKKNTLAASELDQ